VVVIDKAFAYITNDNRLLVFEHAGILKAGIQVPAGSLLPGETLESAVIREAGEETGLSGFADVRFLGVSEFDARPFGKDELHRRHFFHLPFPGVVAEKWRWFENDPSDGSQTAIEFDLFWVSFSEARECLSYGHGAFIKALTNE